MKSSLASREKLMLSITPELAALCLLSFEGPDSYVQAGGLGVRISHLAEALAERGFETHLFFVGDPGAAGPEQRLGGPLTLHRWCQGIPAYHRSDVYEAEEAKLHDFSHSAPLRRHCVLFWSANNTMSFNRVNWPRLNHVSHITTVSRYMKHLMWDMSLNPLVIPKGIPATLLEPVDPEPMRALRHVLDPDQKAIFLFKVGRFDLAKRRLMAIEAAAQKKAAGHQARSATKIEITSRRPSYLL
jgi:hypothetical protein